MTENQCLWAQATMEGNAASIAGTQEDDLVNLGAENPNTSWVLMKWNGGWSFFLEPLFQSRKWDNPSESAQLTRAHEVALLSRGQYAGGYRLIPQVQEPVGGLYSVRGYPEAAVAGDTGMFGTTEYRWHIPRSFHIEPHPDKTPLFGRPFRFSPQEPLGHPDWDLIWRTFFDIGRTFTNGQPDEPSETLMGWGTGVELQIRQNFSIRCDWAMALRDLPVASVSAGESRFYLVGTISW
jgi:hypothetical protein